MSRPFRLERLLYSVNASNQSSSFTSPEKGSSPAGDAHVAGERSRSLASYARSGRRPSESIRSMPSSPNLPTARGSPGLGADHSLDLASALRQPRDGRRIRVEQEQDCGAAPLNCRQGPAAGAVLHAQTAAPELRFIPLTWTRLWGVTPIPGTCQSPRAIGRTSLARRPTSLTISN
jgi:hypothetical protein